jgi:hypothetical protein
MGCACMILSESYTFSVGFSASKRLDPGIQNNCLEKVKNSNLNLRSTNFNEKDGKISEKAFKKAENGKSATPKA